MKQVMTSRVFLIVLLTCSVTAQIFAQITPPPPQPIRKQGVARCNSRVHGNSRTTVQDPRKIPYSPQPDWAILSYSVATEGEFGTTTKNWTSVPGNYTFSSSADVTNAYNAAIGLAVAANIKGKELADLKAELSSSYNAYNAYHTSIAAGQATILLETNAKGNGVLVGTGSDVAIRLDVVEVQVDPNMKTASQFRTYIMDQTKKRIAALKRAESANQHRTE